MKKSDICCIGHITHDKIVTPKLTVHSPGGTAFYFAHAMSRLHAENFLLATALGAEDMGVVDDIRSMGVEVKVLPSRFSVYFENHYGENQDNRTQRVLAKADPFTVDGIGDIEARYYHLGTLLADDFPIEIIRMLSGKGIVSVDAQGYLRQVRGQEVLPVDWDDKREALPLIDILKVNEHEAGVLSGEPDPIRGAEQLAEWGVKEVVLTLGSMGSIILSEGKRYDIPAFAPNEVVDATGCGDTYMAGYLYKRSKGAGCDEAGRFAAAMCTLKLEASGPFRASMADVESLIASHQYKTDAL